MVLKAFLDHLESKDHSEKNGLKSERRNEWVVINVNK